VRIYADTSYLVSTLYTGDVRHVVARRTFHRHFGDDWISTGWLAFETANTFRQLCLGGLASNRAEGLIRMFRRLHTWGPFQAVDVDMELALADCHQLSAAAGSKVRMRSADVLHVALLEQLSADLFITRDADQFALAQSKGFSCLLV
jgi:predicted nucleic acid-binding protein